MYKIYLSKTTIPNVHTIHPINCFTHCVDNSGKQQHRDLRSSGNVRH